MKKIALCIIAGLMIMAMMLPSAGKEISTQAAENYKGSVTYTASGDWAESKEIPMNELIGNTNPSDVTAIKFTSDVEFKAGYNATSGSWKWADSAKSYTATDIRFDDWYTVKFAITLNDGKAYTIKWEVFTEDGVVSEEPATGSDGEKFAVETIINPGWGVYTNTIPVSTLEKYKDGMVIDIEFKVQNGKNFGMLSPVNNIEGWPKLVDYITGAKFDSEDGGFVTFGADATNVKMTLTKEGVQKVISNGGGLIIQGYQVEFTGMTLSSAVAKDPVKPTAAPTATPTPKPTATPTPSVTADGARIFTYAEQKTKKQVTELSMKPDETVDLCFKGVLDYTHYTCKWVSSNEEVATVDNSGVITAKAQGTAKITFVVGDGKAYTSTPVEVTIVSMNLTAGTSKNKAMSVEQLKVGKTLDLNFYGVTDWAYRKSAYLTEWTTSDSKVATVNQSTGLVTAVAPGVTVVIFHIYDMERDILLSSSPVTVIVTE